MAGRPINENLATAKLVGDKTYEGSVHAACGTTTRYTSGGGCVACARAKQTKMREALERSTNPAGAGVTMVIDDINEENMRAAFSDRVVNDPVEDIEQGLTEDEGPAYKEPWD
jgi:hypothetical protein